MGRQTPLGFDTHRGASNPLSRLTVSSLGDLGYQVDMDVAEDSGLPDLLRAAREGNGVPNSATRTGVALPFNITKVPAGKPVRAAAAPRDS